MSDSSKSGFLTSSYGFLYFFVPKIFFLDSIIFPEKKFGDLKGNKGQNQYLTRVFIGRIQVTFIKCVFIPDKVIFEISQLKVGIRSLGGRNPNKRS